MMGSGKICVIVHALCSVKNLSSLYEVFLLNIFVIPVYMYIVSKSGSVLMGVCEYLSIMITGP